MESKKKINAVKRYRQKKGMTQSQLAKTLDVSRQTIINWEKGFCPNYIAYLFDLIK